jgi:hypothetical protein
MRLEFRDIGVKSHIMEIQFKFSFDISRHLRIVNIARLLNFKSIFTGCQEIFR